MVTVISCSLWRHFYWESITLSVEDAIYERVECGKSEKGSVLLKEGSKGECGKARPVLKKKEERKKEAAFSIKDIGRGYILWWYLCTAHPDSISLNCVQYVCPFPTHSSLEIFFYQSWPTEVWSLCKNTKTHNKESVIEKLLKVCYFSLRRKSVSHLCIQHLSLKMKCSCRTSQLHVVLL